MAVLSQEEFLRRVSERVSGDTSPEATAFVEDMADTYAALADRQNQTDWEARYRENDAAWRQRYTDRFFSGRYNPEKPPEEDKLPREETIHIDDLFE